MSATICLLDSHNNSVNNNGVASNGGTWVYTSSPSGLPVTVGTTSYTVGSTLPTDNPCIILNFTSRSDFGDYVFTYTVQGCNGTETATNTITAVGAGINQTNINCTYSANVTNSNWLVNVGTNDMTVEACADVYTSNSCIAGQFNPQTICTEFETYNYYRFNNGSCTIQGSGYIESITLAIDDGFGGVTYHLIDLDPATTGTIPYFSGANSTTFRNAVRAEIINQMSVLGASVDVDVVYVGGIFEIRMVNTNQPTSSWGGIDLSNTSAIWYQTFGSTPCTNPDIGTSTNTTSFLPSYFVNSPCGNILPQIGNLPTGGIDYLLFLSNVNFNEIIVNQPQISITGGDGAADITCSVIELRAFIIPTCSVTPTYIWSNSETTEIIQVAAGSGTYSVTIDCPDYPCTSSASVTV